MNKVILVGRLTKDVDTRYAGEIVVARFTLAVDRRFRKDGEQTADFLNIVAFGKNAEFCSKYFHKGMKVVVDGRLQTGSYTNKDGVKIYTTDVIAEAVEFAESKKTEEQTNKNEDWQNTDNDVDLPFI